MASFAGDGEGRFFLGVEGVVAGELEATALFVTVGQADGATMFRKASRKVRRLLQFIALRAPATPSLMAAWCSGGSSPGRPRRVGAFF